MGATCAMAALAALGIGGCGSAPGELDERTSTTKEDLYVGHYTWGRDPNGVTTTIPVCWEPVAVEGSDFAALRGVVQQAVTSTWGLESNVSFVGWGVCAGGGIQLSIGDAQPRTDQSGMVFGNTTNVTLNFTFANWSTSCASQAYKSSCVYDTAVHEFGHALGFNHEQARSDTPSWCTNRDSSDFFTTILGGTPLGPWDEYSVMNYCNPIWDNGGRLSPGDVRGVQWEYGRSGGEVHAFPTWDARVFYLGRDDDHMHSIFPAAALHEDLSALSGAPAALSSTFAHITGGVGDFYLYTGKNGDIYSIGRGASWPSWVSSDMSIESAAPPAASGPVAYETPDLVRRVLYVGRDAHIHEIHSNFGWFHDDLSALAGSPDAASLPFGYSTPDGMARVVYRSRGDDHIQELRLMPYGWQRADLSARAGAPPAVDAPSAYVTADGVARVVYTGQDGDVHELRLTAAGWQHADLTTLSGAGPSVSAPIAYTTPTDSTARVIVRTRSYDGAANHVEELHLDPTLGWRAADLSVLARAPDTLGPPSTHSRGGDGVPRVVYLGNEGNVHALDLGASGWVHTDLSAASGAPPGH